MSCRLTSTTPLMLYSHLVLSRILCACCSIGILRRKLTSLNCDTPLRYGSITHADAARFATLTCKHALYTMQHCAPAYSVQQTSFLPSVTQVGGVSTSPCVVSSIHIYDHEVRPYWGAQLNAPLSQNKDIRYNQYRDSYSIVIAGYLGLHIPASYVPSRA